MRNITSPGLLSLLLILTLLISGCSTKSQNATAMLSEKPVAKSQSVSAESKNNGTVKQFSAGNNSYFPAENLLEGFYYLFILAPNPPPLYWPAPLPIPIPCPNPTPFLLPIPAQPVASQFT